MDLRNGIYVGCVKAGSAAVRAFGFQANSWLAADFFYTREQTPFFSECCLFPAPLFRVEYPPVPWSLLDGICSKSGPSAPNRCMGCRHFSGFFVCVYVESRDNRNFPGKRMDVGRVGTRNFPGFRFSFCPQPGIFSPGSWDTECGVFLSLSRCAYAPVFSADSLGNRVFFGGTFPGARPGLGRISSLEIPFFAFQTGLQILIFQSQPPGFLQKRIRLRLTFAKPSIHPAGGRPP
jgi:hypothetical protein